MEDVLCDITAFRFHRVPPQVLMLLPMLPSRELDRNRRQLESHPLVTEALGCPIHFFREGRKRSRAGARVVEHALSGSLPAGATMDSGFGVQVATPLFTLLTMASSVSEYLLIMAMYELCGTFAVFQPSPMLESLLDHACAEHVLDPTFGWRRMIASDGRKTSLWKRRPLVTVEEIRKFVNDTAGMRGAKNMARAAAALTGITASPFEAQTSMLLGLGRRRGGWGLRIENNVALSMTQSARRISGTDERIADIVVTSDDGDRSVIVECQGEAFHGSVEARLRDSDRTTALQSMGHQVIQITYGQIRDEEKCSVLIKLIERLLGMSHRDKTKLQQDRETQMRREIFVPWESF